MEAADNHSSFTFSLKSHWLNVSMCQALVRVGDTTVNKITQALSLVRWEIETHEHAMALRIGLKELTCPRLYMPVESGVETSFITHSENICVYV